MTATSTHSQPLESITRMPSVLALPVGSPPVITCTTAHAAIRSSAMGRIAPAIAVRTPMSGSVNTARSGEATYRLFGPRSISYTIMSSASSVIMV